MSAAALPTRSTGVPPGEFDAIKSDLLALRSILRHLDILAEDYVGCQAAHYSLERAAAHVSDVMRSLEDLQEKRRAPKPSAP